MIWTNEEGSLYPPAMMSSGVICNDYLPDDIKKNFIHENMLADVYKRQVHNRTDIQAQMASDTFIFIENRLPLFFIPCNGLMSAVKAGYIASSASHTLILIEIRIEDERTVNVLSLIHI